MLSRVAERVYWIGRYIERTESTARLLLVYSGLLLDLPPSVGISWRNVCSIMGYDDPPLPPGDTTREQVLGFLVANPGNPSSLLRSIEQARENARTTREILPSKVWRALNELQLFGRSKLTDTDTAPRLEDLDDIIERCQLISGLVTGTMSRGVPYRFLKLGQDLERADMSSRIIDVGAQSLLSSDGRLGGYENSLWITVLRSLSAYQMYCQSVRRRVIGSDVINFLLKDKQFPRSIYYCLNAVRTSLGKLPNHDGCLVPLTAGGERVTDAKVRELDVAAIRRLMDELQRDIGNVHNAVVASWFQPEAHSSAAN